jgi:hypothetical protein
MLVFLAGQFGDLAAGQVGSALAGLMVVKASA